MLLSVGATEKDEDYEYAKQNGVYLIPPVDYKNLNIYFSIADAYLYMVQGKQNLHFASVGIAPLEALACNTPVVGYTLIHIPNNEGEKVGFIVRNNDEAYHSIKKIFDNPNLFGETRWVVEKYFYWPKIVDEILEVYYRLFKQYYLTNFNEIA